MLFLGRIDEQALAVNVEGKGIVLVVGCGHQTVPRMLHRASQLFDEPIHGIVGGLHYPLPHGRLKRFGLDLQNLLVARHGEHPGAAVEPSAREAEETVSPEVPQCADPHRATAIELRGLAWRADNSGNRVARRSRARGGSVLRRTALSALALVAIGWWPPVVGAQSTTARPTPTIHVYASPT